MATIFTDALGTDRGDVGLGSFRNVIAITGGALGQVRATFKAGASNPYVIVHASIGIWSGSTMITTATPVELTFSGASGCTIPAATTLTSDWVNLSGFTSSNSLVVVEDFNSATSRSTDQSSSNTMWFNFGDQSYNKADPTPDGGWGSTVSWVVGVTSIETQSGGGGGPPIFLPLRRIITHRRRPLRPEQPKLLWKGLTWQGASIASQ